MGTLRMGVNFAVRRFLAVLVFLGERGWGGWMGSQPCT